ncbi:hypothetical protein ISF_08292 [Cordyceps fumosorosea ARSEF 2679]|uniref:Uncharacterized protein n=1 Tax=Cordyceps fumosorosea (strain ARSEF 2679) TaxID=1081104 RepID=A0A167MS14_CORFA|nr:hypothetical protein ISF_08292 [Cordyceps fumosorosea ARSEF 2679]OAA54691.1 hypothetical protein ISF_08292 [Cordyceps fumosorosea ARSEF 2679]
MSTSIKHLVNAQKPRELPLRIAIDGPTGSTAVLSTTATATLDLGAAARFEDTTSPVRLPIDVPLWHRMGYVGSVTPKSQFAAFFREASQPVNPCLLRELLAVALSERQELQRRGEEPTWPRDDSGVWYNGSPPPEFWETDPEDSPTALPLLDQSKSESNSPPELPTPTVFKQTWALPRKRTYDQLVPDDDYGGRDRVAEPERRIVDAHGARKRRRVGAAAGC